MSADSVNQPTIEGRLQGMLDRAWKFWPSGNGRDNIMKLTFPGNTPGDGAAIWTASVLWHHYKGHEYITVTPRVVKAWSFGWDPFGKNRKGDVDFLVVNGKGSKKIKIAIKPISQTVYQTAVIEWRNGRQWPVWGLWASTARSGIEWHYVMYTHEKSPPHPSLPLTR